MYIQRFIEKQIPELLQEFPTISIIGPRQSGKTTLAKKYFNNYKYYSLESPDTQLIISEDTRSFIERNKENIIIDEIQNYPELLSYLQEYIDNGIVKNWIITGSMAFNVMEILTQTLSGRTAILTLFPFSLPEIEQIQETTTEGQILKGLYPSVIVKKTSFSRFYENYIATYLERDIRQIVNIRHFHQFRLFMKLLAGRTGNEFNASNIAQALGVSTHTIQAWTSAMEAMFSIFFLPAYYTNFNKRIIKSPKLFFIDTGIACHLLGIKNSDLLWQMPLYGHLYENFVINEIRKLISHLNLPFDIFYYRENKGIEIDLIIETSLKFHTIEIKSSKTFNKTFLKNLIKFKDRFDKMNTKKTLTQWVLYNGTENFDIQNIKIANYKSFINNILPQLT